MEFFRYLPSHLADGRLEQLGIDDLPGCCASIDRVLASAGDTGTIYCLWGQFGVRREVIRGGVRFTLPKCPNALAWTLTEERPPTGEPKITIHCTINRESHDPDFVATIHQFVDDWQEGLARLSP